MDAAGDVTLTVNSETARLLSDPVRRRAVSRYLDALLRDDANSTLAEAIADLKREAQAGGLTDEIVDAELEAWREERRNRQS
jgi:hypothetical protein